MSQSNIKYEKQKSVQLNQIYKKKNIISVNLLIINFKYIT